MSTKVKFVALLTVVVVLMSLLMNSYSFSAPHRRNPEAGGFLTFLIFVGVFVGLFILVVLALYMRDLPEARRRKRFTAMGAISLKNALSFILSGVILAVIFKIIMGNGKAGVVPPNLTNCTLANGTSNLTNCTIVPSVGPLAGENGNYTTRFLNNPVATKLWMVFLVPLFLGILYLAYQYVRLLRAEAERKRKLEMAVEFDRKLDELGLERFSNPKEAIVEIYKNAVLWLEGLGIPYRESWTHWEHAEHVEYMHEAFVELTKLFEKAKYAPERLGWSDAERALEVYNKLRGKAREVVEGN